MLDLLSQSEAVQLFLERARAVQPGFALGPATAAEAAAICRRLDGLPLAIELAAARLDVLPVGEVLARLDDRFRLLRHGKRGAGDRHQALQATMDWSYGLLDPAERALLRRLAVFAGGWDVGAAEAVCAGEEIASADVLSVLDELRDRSLVYVHAPDGEPRYGMLETVRQYAAQQLERTGEAAVVRDQHLTWCVLLIEQAAPALVGLKQAVWLARLVRDFDNLRAALQWALDRSLSTAGLRVAGGLGKFWLRGGHQREGRRWLAAVLSLPLSAEDTEAMAVRAIALEAAAGLAEDAHEFAQATALYVESGALKRTLGQAEHSAAMLLNAAMEARAGGEYARATALQEECLAQYRRRGNRDSPRDDDLGLSLSFAYRFTFLALILREQGEYERAIALCEECLALTRELGDAEGKGQALLSLADIARDQGDTARVRVYGEESLTLFRDLGHPYAIGFALNNLAQAAYLDGDLAQAASRAEESAAIFRGMGGGPSLAEVLVTLSRVRAAQGEAAAARAYLAEALTLARDKGPRLVAASALEETRRAGGAAGAGATRGRTPWRGSRAARGHGHAGTAGRPPRSRPRWRRRGRSWAISPSAVRGPRGRRYQWSRSSPRHWPARRTAVAQRSRRATGDRSRSRICRGCSPPASTRVTGGAAAGRRVPGAWLRSVALIAVPPSGDRPSQGLQRARLQHLDCPFGSAHAVGGLRDGQLRHEAVVEHVALRGRQGAEQPVQGLAVLAGGDRRLGTPVVGVGERCAIPWLAMA